MSERKLWTPVHLDSDFDLQDSEGGLICLQASCASDEMMCEIATAVNYHERLVEMVGALLANPSDSFTVHMAESLIADMESEKGGEL